MTKKTINEILGVRPAGAPAAPPPDRNPAEWMYERIARQIIDFEKRLSVDEEVGGRFVAAPREGDFRIKDIDYWNPDMLIFEGTDADGRPIQLLQHYSQLSMVLCAVRKNKDSGPKIGFNLEGRLKKEG
jgi:Family of unknown function (DUF6173)